MSNYIFIALGSGWFLLVEGATQGNVRQIGQFQTSCNPEPQVVLAHPHYKRFVQRTGRVIYICEKRHSRFGAGFLTIFPDKNPRFAKFSPTDPCVPRMKIPRDQCPQDFFMRPQDFKTRMFACQIIKWDQVNMAMGQLTKNLGDGNDMGARTEALLIQHEIDDRDFSRAVEACLPSVPFALPVDEIAKRRDFRKECVFTIDPLTARDLDDALSVEKLPDGNFRVGVHIADVAYFVKEGTELDRVAADRATSVYLVHKVVPMLPR
jgi:DIS3-like exonuclease 2